MRITILFILLLRLFDTDLLDNVKSNSRLVNDLKDIYRAYKVNHTISDQTEFLNVFIRNEDSEFIRKILNQDIEACEKLKNQQITNDTLNSYLQNYLSLTIQSYRLLRDKGAASKEFKNDYEHYKAQKKTYSEYLEKNYSQNRFTNLTEEKYWQTIDKKNYIKSISFADYQKLKKPDLKKAISLMENISNLTTDFQEYSIYQIELADQYVKHDSALNDFEGKSAVTRYKRLIDQKKYSLYLFESWLKWRTVLQQNNGLSKFSEIPNGEYDKVREQEALVVLEYITNHETDDMAINQFLLLATHDIVRRFGDYQFGNQNTIEFHEIFDDHR